jgi:hypothetical protein
MIEIGMIARFAGSKVLAVDVLEILVGPTSKAHIFLADRTDNVVAPVLLADGDPTVAAGLAELSNGLL